MQKFFFLPVQLILNITGQTDPYFFKAFFNSFFFLILKNVVNQTAAGLHWIPLKKKKNTMEVNGYRQLFGLFI